jgi:phosphoserine phosphatase SerB
MSYLTRLEVSIDDQRLDVFGGDQLLKSFPISTGAKGVGFKEGSFRTPLGRFRIVEKIGEGEPVGTIFRARVPSGIWRAEESASDDLILTRILRLDGLDAENANTFERFIYIHGTNCEDRLGEPSSHGCIRLSNADMQELFEMVPLESELIIHPPTRRRGKLIFFDCDSTLSSIEGIDELARFRGPEIYAEVVALTHAAMNGEVPLDQVFSLRMEIIKPDRAACEAVAAQYIETITPHARELIQLLKANGWLPVILSGGFAPLIQPLAKELGIDHVEAVPLYLSEDGTYAGFGTSYPTTRNLGKNDIIREWKAAMLPERVVMMGDGISDLETTPDVDLFIGYGGVVSRPKVMEHAAYTLMDMSDMNAILKVVSEEMPSKSA